MQVGQGLAVIEPFGLRHEALEQSENAVRPIDKSLQRGAPVGAVMGAVLVEPGFGAGGVIGRR